MRALDITNNRFGKLTAIRRSDKQIKRQGVIWDCICDCGATCCGYANQLNAGNKTSCGCSQKIDHTGQQFNHLSFEENCPER